ncbi:hypothetical protein [Halomicrobium salinisoli]|uniref:hypothetical protein n=1 Tax=Halomicrobium salinisoli TaxID=2878391 RepID=UPI001CEFC20D|nr:hypothetical protein [Halomicrobium salinisoli]
MAGCTSPSSNEITIQEIQIVNKAKVSEEIAVEIKKGNETLYDENHTVQPADSEPIPVISNDLPEVQGEAMFNAQVINSGSEASVSVQLSDEGCYKIIIEYTGSNMSIFSNRSESC